MGSCISYLLVYIPSVYWNLKTPSTKSFHEIPTFRGTCETMPQRMQVPHWGLYRFGELGNSAKHYQKSIRPVKYQNTCLHQFWDESLSGLSGNAQKVLNKSETKKKQTYQSMTLKSTIMNVPNNFEDKPLSGLSNNAWKPQKCNGRTMEQINGQTDANFASTPLPHLRR